MQKMQIQFNTKCQPFAECMECHRATNLNGSKAYTDEKAFLEIPHKRKCESFKNFLRKSRK